MVITTRSGRRGAQPVRGARGAVGRGGANAGRGAQGRGSAKQNAAAAAGAGARTQGNARARGSLKTCGGRAGTWGNVAPRGRAEIINDGNVEEEVEFQDEEVTVNVGEAPNNAAQLMTDLQQVVHMMVQNAQGGRVGGTRLVEFTKLRPPTFDGLGQPKAAETWLDEMEKYLRAAGVVDTYQKVNLATFHLKDESAKWWLGMVGTYPVGDIDWSEFKNHFNRQFFPESAREEMRSSFYC